MPPRDTLIPVRWIVQYRYQQQLLARLGMAVRVRLNRNREGRSEELTGLGLEATWWLASLFLLSSSLFGCLLTGRRCRGLCRQLIDLISNTGHNSSSQGDSFMPAILLAMTKILSTSNLARAKNQSSHRHKIVVGARGWISLSAACREGHGPFRL
jgi:hypothetical protein